MQKEQWQTNIGGLFFPGMLLLGVALMGQDYSRPPANEPLVTDETIEVVRVREAVEIEEEFIPFETQWVPESKMEIDQQEIRQKQRGRALKTPRYSASIFSLQYVCVYVLPYVISCGMYPGSV